MDSDGYWSDNPYDAHQNLMRDLEEIHGKDYWKQPQFGGDTTSNKKRKYVPWLSPTPFPWRMLISHCAQSKKKKKTPTNPTGTGTSTTTVTTATMVPAKSSSQNSQTTGGRRRRKSKKEPSAVASRANNPNEPIISNVIYDKGVQESFRLTLAETFADDTFGDPDLDSYD